METKFDVAIIGAGIGGLVSGCYLAQKGFRVVLCEQHKTPGGYCCSFKRRGYVFDASVHYLGSIENGILGNVLKELEIKEELELKEVTPSYEIHMPDFVFNIYSDKARIISELKKIFQAESANIDKFFALIFHKELTVISYKYMRVSFLQLLKGFFKDERLIGSINVLLGNIGVAAHRVSAISAILLLRLYMFEPLYYPVEGMQAFPDLLLKQFKVFGGQVLFSSSVKSINTTQNTIKSITLESEEVIHVKYVISNADVMQTFRKLVHHKTKEREVLNGGSITPSAFYVYLGLKKGALNNLRSDSSKVFCSTYDIKKQFITTRKNLLEGDYNLIAVSFPSANNEKRHREKPTVEIFAFAPYLTKAFWKKNRAKITAKLTKVTGNYVGDIKNEIEIIETATPHTFHRYTLNKNGAAFGWQQTVDQMYKICRQKTSVKNLFLAGHWASDGYLPCGVPGVAYSGKRAAELILRDNMSN